MKRQSERLIIFSLSDKATKRYEVMDWENVAERKRLQCWMRRLLKRYRSGFAQIRTPKQRPSGGRLSNPFCRIKPHLSDATKAEWWAQVEAAPPMSHLDSPMPNRLGQDVPLFLRELRGK